MAAFNKTGSMSNPAITQVLRQAIWALQSPAVAGCREILPLVAAVGRAAAPACAQHAGKVPPPGGLSAGIVRASAILLSPKNLARSS
jgi:hypothetical protein